MKLKVFLLILFVTSLITVLGDVFADRVISFSSQYDEDSWSVKKLLGPPDVYPEYGDNENAWTPEQSDSCFEYVEVGFPHPVRARAVRIWWTYNPSPVWRVLVKDEKGLYHLIWEGEPRKLKDDAFIQEFQLERFDYLVVTVRIEMIPAKVQGWNEIDAISLVPYEEVKPKEKIYWASRVIDYSSEYSPVRWSAEQVLGPPDVYPEYGDVDKAWAPSAKDGGEEYIEVSFPYEGPVCGIVVYETYNPGAIVKVLLKDTEGNYHTAWERSGGEKAAEEKSRIFKITFPLTDFSVSSVKIILDTSLVPGWNEIDAIGIIVK